MEKLLRRVYDSRNISRTLKIISHASVILCVISYIALLAHSYLAEPMAALRLAAAGAVPFVIVSITRRIINAPRPYELYDFYEVKPKGKAGQSFPSRHVFSAFIIASLAICTSPWLSLAAALLGTALAVSRVLLGMHFIRDVLAGALIGIICGTLGILILIF